MIKKTTDKGFIEVFIILIIALAAFFIWPRDYSPSSQSTISPTIIQVNVGSGYCQIPAAPPPTITAPSYRIEDKDEIKADGGTATYKLIRKDVPTEAKLFMMGNHTVVTGKRDDFLSGSQTISGKKYRVYFPKGDKKRYDYTENGQKVCVSFVQKNSPNCRVNFHEYGMLYLLHLENDNTPSFISGSGSTRESEWKKSIWLVDFYQNVSNPKEVPSWALECNAGTVAGSGDPISVPSPEITSGIQGPANGSADRKQLQLESFVPNQQIIQYQISGGGGLWVSECKPAIYLYPQEKQYINVRVNTKGELTYTDPQYPLLGWTTLAYPDGRLFVDGKEYPYLYYESKIPDSLIQKPTKGYVVSREKLSFLFSDILPRLGLDSFQAQDFKDYWEKTLPKSPYYFVGIMDQKNIDVFEPLVINPMPKTSIRVRLYFEALSEKKMVEEPAIITPQKHGFTMVEWGGMVKTDKDHPFTCSQ